MNKERVAKQLLTDEGLRLKPYRCTAGKLTIGVGRNLDDKGITEAEAFGMLDNDIDECYSDLLKALPFFATLDDVRQEVLVNMRFNLGLKRILGFQKTLALIAAGKYSDAADEMLNSAWATQVGNRAKRLSKMMADG